jgi:quercetin dioxygenase-like cupin family protein
MAGAVIWTSGSVPADNVNDTQGDRRDPSASLKGGSVMRVTEFAPGFATPTHRTLSIDYAMVLSGELELELDSRSVVRLRKGDVIVQRGAHLWRNPSVDTAAFRLSWSRTRATATRRAHRLPAPGLPREMRPNTFSREYASFRLGWLSARRC